jgi:hypothetical protein
MLCVHQRRRPSCYLPRVCVHGGGQGIGGRQHTAPFEAWKKKLCEAKV